MKAVILLATVTGALAQPSNLHTRSVGDVPGDFRIRSFHGRQLRFLKFGGDEDSGTSIDVAGNYDTSKDYRQTHNSQSDNRQDHRDYTQTDINNSKTSTDESLKYTDAHRNESKTDIDESQFDLNSGTQVNGDQVGHEVNLRR